MKNEDHPDWAKLGERLEPEDVEASMALHILVGPTPDDPRLLAAGASIPAWLALYRQESRIYRNAVMLTTFAYAFSLSSIAISALTRNVSLVVVTLLLLYAAIRTTGTLRTQGMRLQAMRRLILFHEEHQE